jgi:hypothetical protein
MVNLVTADSLVCADHFEPSSFPYANKSSTKLVWNANPTIPARDDNKERFSKNNESKYSTVCIDNYLSLS